MNKIMTPQLVEKLGIKRHCSTCYPKQRLGKGFVKGQMCPQCGNHFDEFGNHNKHRALKWIYQTFQQAGFQLSELHVESLYSLARIKVANNEATYIEVIEAALDTLRNTGKLPE